ncbi:MAG: metal ABC transporter permease, partial [Amylibacter sp.]
MASIITQTNVNKEQAMNVIHKVMPYLWPADKAWVKVRVVLSLLALIVGKVISVMTPFFYKGAVDAMAPDHGGPDTIFLLTAGAVGLTIAYGVARLMSV